MKQFMGPILEVVADYWFIRKIHKIKRSHSLGVVKTENNLVGYDTQPASQSVTQPCAPPHHSCIIRD
jgi:hypothetical protein